MTTYGQPTYKSATKSSNAPSNSWCIWKWRLSEQNINRICGSVNKNINRIRGSVNIEICFKLLKCYCLRSRIKQYHLRGASVKSELYHLIVIATTIVMIVIIIFDHHQQRPTMRVSYPTIDPRNSCSL